ncbi:MAG: helix-turn-helix transcriptional regulator [Candidatus Kapabacteria bacterium]|nr:helix-turn-helix transcriptional regulator [Ignavibacteriota bacterium]MCW5885751.1 helix-turn-helix transcriptional regulator [Candidatus Kapabacteria bacterium]
MSKHKYKLQEPAIIATTSTNGTNYSELVKQEIDAFHVAQGQLVTKYQNIIEKLYEFAPVIVIIHDCLSISAPYIYVNKFAEIELGYKPNILINGGNEFFDSIIHNEDIDEASIKQSEFIYNLQEEKPDKGDKLYLEHSFRLKHYKGYYLWFNRRTSLLSRKTDNSPHLLLSILNNINDSVKLQQEKQKRMALEISMLKQKVKMQNEKLQTQLLVSIEFTKFVEGISKFITNISKNEGQKEKELSRNILNYLSKNKPDTNVWEEFTQRFHEINPNFVTFLSSNFPNLTPTEIKVCSLTKTGLNSKDIATILRVSVRSIENHKYNIRKKFGLDSYQNLYNYLNVL